MERVTQIVKLTTHLDLVLRFRNGGTIPLLSIQTSTACQGKFDLCVYEGTFAFISQNFLLYEGLDNENIQLNYK